MSSAVSRRPAGGRRWRWFVIGGVLFALAGAALLLAPPVQAWIVRRVVASQPGWRLNFARFGATPLGVEVHGLDFAMPGLEASCAPIAVRLAPGRLFNKRELRIERIEARKLRVTLTPAQFASADPAAAREPFSGIFALLRLPLAWALDQAQLDGEIAIRDGAQSLVIGTFSLRGGGLSAETPGVFDYEVSVNSSLLPPGPENHVRSRGQIRITQNAAHALAALTIEGDITLPRYGTLALPAAKFTLSAVANPDGETYRGRLDLGEAGHVAFDGTLQAALARLTARLNAHATPALLASVTPGPLPSAALDATAALTLDLRRNDLEATLTGVLAARDWTKLDARLAALPPCAGELSASLARRGGQLALERFSARLQAADAPAAIAFELTQTVDPLALPATPFASVALEHLPFAWANPSLAPHGLALDPAELDAAWTVAFARDTSTLSLAPLREVSVPALTLRGENLPTLPAVALAFAPRATVSPSGATLDIERLSIRTAQGDEVALALAATCDFPTGRVTARGDVSGTAPTLLAGTERAAPFSFHAQWDAALVRRELQLNRLELTARPAATAPPYLALQLLQPVRLDLEKLTVPAMPQETDLARLRFDGLPLDWVSRWIAPRELTGRIVAGDSVLRALPDGKLTLKTVTPWQLADATLGVGGRTFFAGGATIAPTLAVHADHYTAELQEISATHRDGSRIYGTIAADAQLNTWKASTAVELYAELPALPHSEATFGSLYVTLLAKSHNETRTLAVVDQLSLRVLSRDREVLLLDAAAPFVCGLSGAGMLSAATTAPLKLTTGEVPLAWLRPWIPGLEADGVLQPAEFQLTAQLTKYLLRPIKPVYVRNFSARVAGRDIAHAMDFSFYPGADLTLICVPLPQFQLAYSGAAHLTHGAIDVAGQRAVDLDLSVSFVGDVDRILPSGLEYSTRADFAQLSRVPALAGTGFPARGTLVARANGDLLGKSPLELWARIEGMLAADGRRTLPTLELTARGHASPDQKRVVADVALALATQPRATDARFEADLNLDAGHFELTSSFRSEFFDAAEAFAFVDAVQKSRAPAAKSPPAAAPAPAGTPAPRSAAAPLGEPLWSGVRGRFDLDLGTVSYPPYRIDRVRGRLDLRDRELVLSGLNGEMFAGRWRGEARVAYRPDDRDADHAVDGTFAIEQFDSARIVQAVFPTERASVDAKIDVHSRVRSRGNAVLDLIERAEADFTVEGRQGVVRLSMPNQDLAASAALIGGTVLFSRELRALGRLLPKLAAMPVDQLLIAGARHPSGDVVLTELRIDSPQARLLAQGRITAEPGVELMSCPLRLSVDLAAKDEMAEILGEMKLIEPRPRADGYRALKEKFQLGGKAGQPDTGPLYELLARAVDGSKGTWGFLMRKVREKVNKAKPPTAAATPAS